LAWLIRLREFTITTASGKAAGGSASGLVMARSRLGTLPESGRRGQLVFAEPCRAALRPARAWGQRRHNRR
jgi:hypothetical protein